MSITEKFIEWSSKDTAAARFERTVAQGVVSAVIVATPQVIGLIAMPEWATALLVACLMAVLSPMQKQIGEINNE